MSGPEHYREAEQLIDRANHEGHYDVERAHGMLASAQVHATLALAAATALCHPGDDETPPEVANAWHAVAAETQQGGESRD